MFCRPFFLSQRLNDHQLRVILEIAVFTMIQRWRKYVGNHTMWQSEREKKTETRTRDYCRQYLKNKQTDQRRQRCGFGSVGSGSFSGSGSKSEVILGLETTKFIHMRFETQLKRKLVQKNHNYFNYQKMYVKISGYNVKSGSIFKYNGRSYIRIRIHYWGG